MSNIREKKKFTIKDVNGKISEMVIERQVYQIEELNEAYQYEKSVKSCKTKWKEAYKQLKSKPSLKKLIPFFGWFPGYRWKEWAYGDIVSGVTLAVLQLPQAMACSVMAEIPPVNGIYTSIFPVIVYFIFGTSKHISVGTFAVASLMTGAVVSEHMTIRTEPNLTRTVIEPKHFPQYTDVQVAQTLTLTVAMIELSMYVLRLGIVSQLFSETFLSAFTCAAAYHIVNSQIRDLLGLPTEKRRGNFAILFTMYDLVMTITEANFVAAGISCAALTCLLLNRQLLKPWLSKKTLIPFPAELIVVIITIICSKFMNLNENYNINIVGFIPTGLPIFAVPKFELMHALLMDAVIISTVCYSVTISLGLIFAHKCAYEVDPNQELLALGLCNVFGSFCLCMPVSASLSRSVLRYNTGGQTQLSPAMTSTVLLMVLLWAAPIFEPLPRCILASVIIVALTELILKVKTLPRYWQLSRWDFAVWLITFLTTFIVQISYGLVVGLIVSLLVIFIQGHTPHTCLLGIVPNTDLYLDVEKYKVVREIEGIKIFHFSGCLSFTMTNCFKRQLFKKTGLDPQAIYRKKANQLNGKGPTDEEHLNINALIVDLSCVTFADPAGVKFLGILRDDYQRIDVVMLIAGCSGSVYEVITNYDKVERKTKKLLIFPAIHDAVLYTQINIIAFKTK